MPAQELLVNGEAAQSGELFVRRLNSLREAHQWSVLAALSPLLIDQQFVERSLRGVEWMSAHDSTQNPKAAIVAKFTDDKAQASLLSRDAVRLKCPLRSADEP